MSQRPWVRVALASYTCLLGALYLLRPSCPDLATFDYIGWRMREGDTLYVDVIEQNWPGAMWMHALATWLFGTQLWAFRVVDFSLMLLGCVGLHRLASLGGAPATRLLVVPMYQSIYVGLDIWMMGQRDVTAAHLMLPLGALAAMRMAGGARWAPPLIGAGMALVVLTRPTYGIYLPLLYAVDLWLRRETQRPLARIAGDLTLASLTLLAVLVAIALLASPSGALAGWYQAAVLFNARVYSHSASPLAVLAAMWAYLQQYHWVVGLGLAGVFTWWRRGERPTFAAAMLIGVTGATSMLVQGKAFGYHLGAVFSVATLFAADAVASALLIAQVRRTPPRRVVAALACVLALAGSLRKAHNGLGDPLAYALGRIDADAYYARSSVGIPLTLRDVLRAVAYARAHSRPDQTVLTWNRAVMINYLAQRRLPTRVATVGMLDLAQPGLPSLEGWLAELGRTLREAPPALVFTLNAQLPEEHARLWGADASARATRLVREALVERYRLDARFGALDVYILK